MEIKGTIIQILPSQTGQGKNGIWEKRSFVLQTEDKYPKSVAIDIWNSEVESPNVTDNVSVSINLESREFNEKWFTNVVAWKIEQNNGITTAKSTPSKKDSGFPTNGSNEQITDNDEDDIPF